MADPGRVLIADDEETFLLSTADLLRKKGYECDCALDAIMAAEKLRNSEYHLLIADIKMKGNMELELVQDLHKIVEYLPVILVTGYPSMKSAIKSIHLPVEAYLVKPFEFEDLLVQVQSSIKNYQSFKAVRDLQKRIMNWSENLKDVREAQTIRPKGRPSAAIDTFFTLTFQNICGALSNLESLTRSFSAGSPKETVCHLLNCPQMTAVKEVLAETIEGMEKTKTAFKSKELGNLRRKLEELVKTMD
jgi:FixJ family two-component response regulator